MIALPSDCLRYLVSFLPLSTLLLFAQCSRGWYKRCTKRYLLLAAWSQCSNKNLADAFLRLLALPYHSSLTLWHLEIILKRAVIVLDPVRDALSYQGLFALPSTAAKARIFRCLLLNYPFDSCVSLVQEAIRQRHEIPLATLINRFSGGMVWEMAPLTPCTYSTTFYSQVLHQSNAHISRYNILQALKPRGLLIPRVVRELLPPLSERGVDVNALLSKLRRRYDPLRPLLTLITSWLITKLAQWSIEWCGYPLPYADSSLRAGIVLGVIGLSIYEFALHYQLRSV